MCCPFATSRRPSRLSKHFCSARTAAQPCRLQAARKRSRSSGVGSQGERLVHGRCSYTAQTAWIQNATVRDNILMGRAFDAALYAAVIAACALQSDLDLLAAGVCMASALFVTILAWW